MNLEHCSSFENDADCAIARSVWSARSSLPLSNVAGRSRASTLQKRLPAESGSKLRALQTLRAIRQFSKLQLCAISLLALISIFPVFAQEQQPPAVPDNGAMPAEDLDPPDEMDQTNELGEAIAL